jgi:hypothetical protein
MEKEAKKSGLARVPAWVSSLIILTVGVILLILLNDPSSSSLSTTQTLGWIGYAILVTIACFFICKAHPKSVWYTPVICNAMGIMALISNISYAIVLLIAGRDVGISSTDWYFIVGILLSASAAILGARTGRILMRQTT